MYGHRAQVRTVQYDKDAELGRDYPTQASVSAHGSNNVQHTTTVHNHHTDYDAGDVDGYGWGWGCWGILILVGCLFFVGIIWWAWCFWDDDDGTYDHPHSDHHPGSCGSGCGSYAAADGAGTPGRGRPARISPGGDAACPLGESLLPTHGGADAAPRCGPAVLGANGTNAEMVDPHGNVCADPYSALSGAWLADAARDNGYYWGFAAETNAELRDAIISASAESVWVGTGLPAFMDTCIGAYTAPRVDADSAEADALAILALTLPTRASSPAHFDVLGASAAWLKSGLPAPISVSVAASLTRSGERVLLVEPGRDVLAGVAPAHRAVFAAALLRTTDEADVRVADALAVADDLARAGAQAGARSLLDDLDATTYVRDSAGYAAHVFSPARLALAAPALEWVALGASLGAPASLDIWLADTEYASALNALARAHPPAAWRAYFALLAAYGSFEYLPGAYAATPLAPARLALRTERIGLHARHTLAHAVPRPAWQGAMYVVATPAAGASAGAPAALAQSVGAADAAGAPADNSWVLRQHVAARDVPTLAARKRCERQALETVGDQIDAAFVAAAMPPMQRKRISAMIDSLVAARRAMIAASDAITPEGKAALAAKLDALVVRIGRPAGPVPTARARMTDSHWSNVRASRVATVAARFADAVLPFDEWRAREPLLMATGETNAYYNPLSNTVVILVGVTAFPFYDAEYNDASMYGTLGWIAGHEIGHATDAAGIAFDGAGAITNWLPASDVLAFSAADACYVRQYTEAAPETGELNSGARTVTEDGADNTGMRAAYTALAASHAAAHPDAPELPEDVRRNFFGIAAQMWADRQSVATEHAQISTDPHAVGKLRVNKALANMPEFASTFGCAARKPVCALAA